MISSRDITYARNPELSPESLAGLFRRSGIQRPVDNLGRIGRMIANSNPTYCAFDGVNLVGVARAITDFSYCCYLSDLAVDLDYQRIGIGRELVRSIETAVGPECCLVLLAAPSAMDYYRRIGFTHAQNAWLIRRTA